jgi:hypothetical protein
MTRAYTKATPPGLPTATMTQQEFSAGFDRCFARVWAYVSRRVHDRESCERIVREVLTGNLDLLVHPVGERQELSQLKAASDRLIAPANHQHPRYGEDLSKAASRTSGGIQPRTARNPR